MMLYDVPMMKPIKLDIIIILLCCLVLVHGSNRIVKFIILCNMQNKTRAFQIAQV